MPDTTTVFQQLTTEIGSAGAQLVAVSKTKPNHQIQELYDLGQRDFGENRVPELVGKNDALPDDIRWHFIGHLQRNKVKAIAPFVHLIHAVDSLRLLKEINKQAAAVDRTIPVLLQFHIAEEDTKYGLDLEDAQNILNELQTNPLPNVQIAGVMGMATYTDDRDQVSNEFAKLRSYFDQLQSTYFSEVDTFKHLSMGMSGDYPLALAHGSTLVRVGSMLFGAR